MRLLYFILVSFVLVLLFSCSDFTPIGLSDADSSHYSIENDPSALKITAKIQKKISNNGEISNDSWVYIRKDIFSPSIAITDGSAKINNANLESKQEFLNIFNSTFYFSDKIELDINNAYNLTIMLSDQEVYTGILESPSSMISSFTVSKTYPMNKPITVSWSPVLANDSVQISYTKKYSNNQSYSSTFVVSGDSTSYTFPADFFTPGSNDSDSLAITNIDMTISHRVDGVINNAFNSESEFYAETSISKLFSLE